MQENLDQKPQAEQPSNQCFMVYIGRIAPFQNDHGSKLQKMVWIALLLS